MSENKIVEFLKGALRENVVSMAHFNLFQIGELMAETREAKDRCRDKLRTIQRGLQSMEDEVPQPDLAEADA